MMESKELLEHARSFSLASMLSAYPDSEAESTLHLLQSALREHPGAGGLLSWLSAHGDDCNALRSQYVELFDTGKARVSPYETEYGRMRGAGKGQALADISGFYHAFGMGLDGDEMIDHVAVELEFYALLLAKRAYLAEAQDQDGCAIVDDAMRKFLTAHLGTFVSTLAQQIEDRGQGAYTQLFGWTAKLVAGECARLGVTVDPLDFYEDGEREREPRCAHSLPVIQ